MNSSVPGDTVQGSSKGSWNPEGEAWVSVPGREGRKGILRQKNSRHQSAATRNSMTQIENYNKEAMWCEQRDWVVENED